MKIHRVVRKFGENVQDEIKRVDSHQKDLEVQIGWEALSMN